MVDHSPAEHRRAQTQSAPATGCGASAQTWTYFGNGGGPPFRRLVDSGIHAGVGTDSTNVSALDPWVSLFYMTTGRNVAGVLTNAGQQVSRVEALRCTRGCGVVLLRRSPRRLVRHRQYADLAVLSHDYLTVPEPTIRRIESVLTLLGGKRMPRRPSPAAQWHGKEHHDGCDASPPSSQPRR